MNYQNENEVENDYVHRNKQSDIGQFAHVTVDGVRNKLKTWRMHISIVDRLGTRL